MERQPSNINNNNNNNKNINDIINENKELFVKYGAKFDWRDMKGKNYLSWSRNQQSPHFCKSSSAVAVTSSIADRINILQKDSFQNLALSPQVVLNCNADSCAKGGSVAEVY
jgi:cathepsin X